jgi:hypothetical protein
MTTKTVVKPELTDEEKREKLDAHYEAIKEAELEVQKSEDGMIRAQYDLKDAKKEYEGAVLHLRRLISRDPLYVPPVQADPQLELDFDAAYDARLQTPICDAIELSEKQWEKLEAAGVKTVGDFEKLRGGQMPDYPGGLSDLDRVGQATIDKWEDQIVEFLKAIVQPAVAEQAADA